MICYKTTNFSSMVMQDDVRDAKTDGNDEKERFTKINKFFFENFPVLFCKFKNCVYLCPLKQITRLWIETGLSLAVKRRMTLSA